MRFVASEIGLINVDQIVRIQRLKNGEALLILKEDTAMAKLPFEDLETALLPVIPNVTGTKAMNFMHLEDDTLAPYFVPIVGWRVDGVGAHAIMADYEEVASFLVFPDGRVQSDEFGMYDTVEAAVASYLKRQKPPA